MKKILSIVAVALVALGFASCNQNGPSAGSIKIEATNLTIDDSQSAMYLAFYGAGYVTFQGSNETWGVAGALYPTSEDYYGAYSSESKNIALAAYDLTKDQEQFMLTVKAAQMEKKGNITTFTANATDTLGRTFDIKMTYEIPAAPETAIEHAFTENASVMYYGSTGDYYVYVEDAKYLLSLDIYAEALNGAFSSENKDFDANYTFMASVNGTDTTWLDNFWVKANVTPSNEGLDFAVEYFAKDSNLYKFTFSFAEPKAETTKTYTLEGGQFEDLGMWGAYLYGFNYYCMASNADTTELISLGIVPESLEGTLTEKDLEPSNSCVKDGDKLYGIYSAEFTVTVEGELIKVAGWLLCENNVKYEFSMTASAPVEEEEEQGGGDEPQTAPRKIGKKVVKKALPINKDFVRPERLSIR